MRKLFVSLTVIAMLVMGSAFAQEEPVVTQDSGVYLSGGLALSVSRNVRFGVNAAAGFEDLLAPNFDVRAGVGVLFSGVATVRIAGDAIYNFDIDEGGPLTIGAGGGPRIRIGAGSDVGIGILGQVDYAVADNISIFGELDLDLYFSSTAGSGTVPTFIAGVRFGL